MRNDHGSPPCDFCVLYTWLLDRSVFQPVAAVGVVCLPYSALYDICYTFLSRLDSALRVRCVLVVCVTCVHFLNSCGLFVAQCAGSRHCLRASIRPIYFECVQVSLHCAWKRQCRLAAAVCTTCVLRVHVLARAPRQPRPAEAKAIWRFQDFCIVYACVRVGGCCMCERDEQ